MRLFVCFFIFLFLSEPVFALGRTNQYPIGWYHYIARPNDLSQWTQSGANFFLAWPATFSNSTANTFLNTAQSLGAQVMMSVTGNPGASSSLQSHINTISQHPANIAWYTADEPEEFTDPMEYTHNYIEAAPVNLPEGIVHWNRNVYNQEPWASWTDILMQDWYPGYMRTGESYFDSSIGQSYDYWVGGVNWGKTHNRDFVAVPQGFNDNYLMSEEEFRYHALTAIAAGADGILFWHCSPGDDCPQYETNSTLKARIEKIIAYVVKDNEGIIGKAMQASAVNDSNDAYYRGVNDPRMNTNVTTSQLVYRYGVFQNQHVILAVNIANHSGNNSGTALTNVRFTIPGISSGAVTVLGENRTLAINSGVFTDNFSPYQVHAYAAGGSVVNSPTAIPSPTNPATVLPGDLNNDKIVNINDLRLFSNNFFKTLGIFDINKDNKSNIYDLTIIIKNFGRSQ